MTEKKTVVMDARYDADTKRKHRYLGGKGDIDVSIYIRKGADIPKQIVLNLKTQGD